VRLEEIVISRAKGMQCFDWDFYESKNPDVAQLSRQMQWSHFLKRGMVEFREYRWKCGLDRNIVLSGL
jgi:hypothetical protein